MKRLVYGDRQDSEFKGLLSDHECHVITRAYGFIRCVYLRGIFKYTTNHLRSGSLTSYQQNRASIAMPTRQLVAEIRYLSTRSIA